MGRPVEVNEIQPARSARNIVPNNNTIFSRTRGLYIGGSGDVEVEMANGAVVIFVGISTGIVHPLSVVRVLAANTTASDIVGLS